MFYLAVHLTGKVQLTSLHSAPKNITDLLHVEFIVTANLLLLSLGGLLDKLRNLKGNLILQQQNNIIHIIL